MKQKNGTRIGTVEGLRSHLESGGFVKLPDGIYFFRKSDDFFELTDSTLLADSWVEAPRTFEELFASGYTVACDESEFLLERRRAPSISTNARRAGHIAPNGYRFPNGEELRLHLNEGGHVMINGQDRWYRMRANLLECLYWTGCELERSAWNLDDLARTERVVACNEPQLSKDIRAREEADAERNARKFMRAFDEASWPPFKEKQMLYRDDGNDVSARDEYSMMFHIYNDRNMQVVFVMTCGENSQSRSMGMMEAAKLHAALGVWIDQANREDGSRWASNNSQRVTLRGDCAAPQRRANDSEVAAREFDGSFSSALDLMLTGSCLTVKGEHPKRYYIIDAWGTLKAHDGNGLWNTPWLTREMMLGKWEFFSNQIPYGPIDESEARK